MEQKKTINKKIIAIIAGMIAVVCIAVAVAIIALGGNSGKKLAEQLDLAEHYMDELDYEAAIAAYEAAIEIDPMCEDAYLGLAEAYVAMGEYEDAIKVLEDGYEATRSEEIQNAFHPYFDGTVTYEQALEDFYARVTKVYPDVSR